MDDPGGVRGGERVGGLPDDAGRPVRRERTVALDEGGEGGPLDVLHHQPLLVAVGHQVVDGDDVRVVEAGGQPGLALGPGEVR